MQFNFQTLINANKDLHPIIYYFNIKFKMKLTLYWYYWHNLLITSFITSLISKVLFKKYSLLLTMKLFLIFLVAIFVRGKFFCLKLVIICLTLWAYFLIYLGYSFKINSSLYRLNDKLFGNGYDQYIRPVINPYKITYINIDFTLLQVLEMVIVRNLSCI